MGIILQLNPRRISAAIVQRAALSLGRGEIILYPTETIYGLGCDALDQDAVARVFGAKGRPETKPVLVLVGNFTMLKSIVSVIPPVAGRLMKAFWPGPLTLIFEAHAGLNPLLTAGSGRVGVRIPGHPFCQKLLKDSKVPIVSTSANLSGEPPVHSVESLKEIFVNRVDLFIDAGDLPRSLPSTVLDVSGGTVKLVREGAIGRRVLARCL